MKAPWLTVTGKGAQGACGTCGALFILAIVYDRRTCPLCGAAGSDSLDREQFEAEAAALASQTEQAAAAVAEWEARR